MTRLETLLVLATAAATAALTGCSSHIGDHCSLNTDCSLQGTKVCDNSQPNGYCTTFNCAQDSCLDSAVCVLLYSALPGCPYNGYQSPSRTARTMCLAVCQQNSDCRVSEGYECVDPMLPPINGLIIDDNTVQKVCIAKPDFAVPVPPDAASEAAAVCLPNGPPVTPYDASLPDGPLFTPLDASPADAPVEASFDALMTPIDAGAPDAGGQ